MWQLNFPRWVPQVYQGFFWEVFDWICYHSCTRFHITTWNLTGKHKLPNWCAVKQDEIKHLKLVVVMKWPDVSMRRGMLLSWANLKTFSSLAIIPSGLIWRKASLVSPITLFSCNIDLSTSIFFFLPSCCCLIPQHIYDCSNILA